MDIIKLTRELGKAIQQDERYLKFVAAREANEADTELNDLVGKMQLIHMSYQHEASKEDANEQKLQAYEEEFMGIREKIIANPNMATYEAARMAIDEMSLPRSTAVPATAHPAAATATNFVSSSCL